MPIINITPLGRVDGQYWVETATSSIDGSTVYPYFVINLEKNQPDDVMFNWQALASADTAKISVSDETTELINITVAGSTDELKNQPILDNTTSTSTPESPVTGDDSGIATSTATSSTSTEPEPTGDAGADQTAPAADQTPAQDGQQANNSSNSSESVPENAVNTDSVLLDSSSSTDGGADAPVDSSVSVSN